MGGCLTPPKPKKPHPAPQVPILKPRAALPQPLPPLLTPPKPKHKQITIESFLRSWQIEQPLGSTTRAQGPKYISSYTDGVGRVLRVLPNTVSNSLIAGSQGDTETRLKIYEQLLQLQVLQDQQGNLLILQQYYCGPYLHQLTTAANNHQQKIKLFLIGVYELIESFHNRGVILGNLSIFSFRQTSQFDQTVRLVELNLSNSNVDQNMGHAFKGEKAMDWQSFGFMVQAVLTAAPPVFIPHKIQYIEPEHPVIGTLLHGKKPKKQQLTTLSYVCCHAPLILGYTFRHDILSYLKLRRRRIAHPEAYYSHQLRNEQGHRVTEEALLRAQTQRIHDRVQGYIGQLGAECEQGFMMYGAGGEGLIKLRAVFRIDAGQRMQEFRETLLLIK